jgi:hypothetical protein
MRARIALILLALGSSIASAADLWLAVGYGGRRMVSSDGKSWEITAEWAQPGSDDGNNLMSAVFAQGKFVVVGGGGGGPTGAGHILVSKDGREWNETLKDKARINPVVFGNGRFVVGTSGYPSGKLMWSSDATAWTNGAKISTKGLTHFRGGAFGNGVFVLVGNGGGNGGTSWAVVTPDGEKITSERSDLPAQGKIIFGAGRFVMLSHEGVLLSSADGADWKVQPFAKEETPRWLVFDSRKFMAGSNKTGWESADGLTWKKGGITSAAGVVWSDGTRFIATGWPGKMSYSPDGATWIKGNELPPNGINVVVKAEP